MPAERFRDRLLTKAEIDECWDDCVRIGDVRDEYDIPDEARVCVHENAASAPQSETKP